MTRVTIVDARPAFRHAVSAALASEGFIVERPEDVEAWGRQGHRVVLVNLTEPNNAELVARLQQSNATTVIVGLVQPQAQAYAGGLRAGAHSVASLQAHPALVMEAVHAAIAGRVVLPVAVAAELTDALGDIGTPPVLSEAQHQILRLMAAGMTMATIADRMHISVRTLHRETNDVLSQLGVTTRAEALVKAARWGLLDDD